MHRIYRYVQTVWAAIVGTAVSGQDLAIQERPAAAMPLFFIENCGQWEPAARFVGRARGFSAVAFDDRIELQRKETGERATVALTFVGGRAEPTGEQTLSARIHSLVGPQSKWRSHIRTHGGLRYRQVWPGIDVDVHTRSGELEYDVLLTPGADLSRASFQITGATSAQLTPDGALLLTTALGDLRHHAPQTWEVGADGTRHEVPSRFVLRGESAFGFEALRRDPSRPLVVDPVLTWGTYFGGNGIDTAYGCTVDAAGFVYLCGSTEGGIPVTAGAYQTADAFPFIAKLNPSATGAAQLVWCTFLGGTNLTLPDTLSRLAVGPAGEVVAFGFGNTGGYPLTANAYATTGDGVVSVLSSDGASLLYSTRLAGTGAAVGHSLYVQADGRIVIGASVLNSSWPTTAGAFQTAHAGAGAEDLWFACLDRTLTGSAQLTWGTYFGGTGSEILTGIAPAASGLVTFAAHTSNAASCPHEFATGTLSGQDWIVGQFNPALSGAAQKRFARVKGATGNDQTGGVAVATNGEIVVGGTSAGFLTLLRLSSSGASVLVDWAWRSAISGFDSANVLLSPDGAVTLCGTVDGRGTYMPVTADAVQSTHQGARYDGYVCQLDPSTQQIVFGSYLASPNEDRIRPQCAHIMGDVLTVAMTAAQNMPLQNHYSTYNFNFDTYLARLDLPAGASSGAGTGPRDVELIDLDNDGDLDVATANETSDNVSLRTNNGLGALSAEATVGLTVTDEGPVALARGDLDNDGARDDLVVVCETSNTVVLITNPAGTPGRTSLAVDGLRPLCVACGDLDANPVDDVVVGRQGEIFAGGSGIALIRNGGAAASLTIPAPHPTQVVKVALGDLDGDGDLDLAAIAQGSSDEVLLFAGDGAGVLTFAGALALSTSGLANGLCLTDIDRDGRNDLAIVQPVLFPPSQSLRVYRRTTTGALAPGLFVAGSDITTAGTLALDLASGDLEQDSIAGFFARVDLAQANAGSGTVTINHGFTSGAFTSSSSPTAGTNPVAVAVGDLNGDGCDDVVVANQGSDDVTVLLTTAPALAQTYGTGCGGPTISAVGLPTLGNAAFGVRISNGRATAPALFMFSTAPADIALPPSTCRLLLANPVSQLLVFTNGSGQATLPVGVPNANHLRAADVYFQGAVFRSPGGAFAGILDFSDALRVQVGQ